MIDDRPICACGCGEPTDTVTDRTSRFLKYRRGHRDLLVSARVSYFWAHVQKTESCWLWTGRTARSGGNARYSRIAVKVNGKWVDFLAHRWSYEYFIGPIPDGYTIDHVKARGCTSTLCVNPEHLEAVTLQENVLRSESIAALCARKTHCIRGHPFDEENTFYFIPQGDVRPKRGCRECKRLHNRAQYLKRKNNKEIEWSA